MLPEQYASQDEPATALREASDGQWWKLVQRPGGGSKGGERRLAEEARGEAAGGKDLVAMDTEAREP